MSSTGLLLLAPFLLDAAGRGPSGRKHGRKQASNDADDAAAAEGGAAHGGAGGGRGGASSRRPGSLVQMAARVLARVPDGRDLTHRHFACTEQLLELEDVPTSDADALPPIARMGGAEGGSRSRTRDGHGKPKEHQK